MSDRTTTIGLTGSVGSGKSTVLSWLASRGAAVLDADRVVHELLSSDSDIVEAVARHFGQRMRAVSGEGIDRRALSEAVFAAPGPLVLLEALVHPAVEREVDSWLSEVTESLAVVEAVKLVESGMAARFDFVWLVVCDRDVRRERLVQRGWSLSEAERRIAAGSALTPEMAAADLVIDNSGTEEETVGQLEIAFEQLGLNTQGDG